MKLLKVIDVIFRKKPDKTIIYSGDELLFNNYTKLFEFNNVIWNMDALSYEYIDKEKTTLLIRVINKKGNGND